MKKVFTVLFCIIIISLFVFSASATTELKIISQPQNPTYNEYAVAMYEVTAKGSNLTCTWFLDYQGTVYNLSEFDAANQPWSGYAGSRYGHTPSNTEGEFTTFGYFFEGIGIELNGSKIYAEITDGQNKVTTQSAYITVAEDMPTPPKTDVPAEMTVYKGDILELYCEAVCAEGRTAEYLWYETSTGLLQDIIAVNRGSETKSIFRCDTSFTGTRYYICSVNDSAGGSAYTSAIKVNVIDKPVSDIDHKITTEKLPDAVVGQSYYVKLDCTDPDAAFGISYNPGQGNDFSKTELNLTQHGEIEGTPTKAGTYTFTVSAACQNNDAYMTYTLTVKAPPETTVVTDAPTEPETVVESDPTTEPVTETQDSTTSPAENITVSGETTAPEIDETKNNDKTEQSNDKGLPVWGVILIAIGAAGLGVCGTVIALKIKK